MSVTAAATSTTAETAATAAAAAAAPLQSVQSATGFIEGVVRDAATRILPTATTAAPDFAGTRNFKGFVRRVDAPNATGGSA